MPACFAEILPGHDWSSILTCWGASSNAATNGSCGHTESDAYMAESHIIIMADCAHACYTSYMNHVAFCMRKNAAAVAQHLAIVLIWTDRSQGGSGSLPFLSAIRPTSYLAACTECLHTASDNLQKWIAKDVASHWFLGLSLQHHTEDRLPKTSCAACGSRFGNPKMFLCTHMLRRH